MFSRTNTEIVEDLLEILYVDSSRFDSRDFATLMKPNFLLKMLSIEIILGLEVTTNQNMTNWPRFGFPCSKF